MITIPRSFGEQRRSHRVHIAISVLVRGKRGDTPFEEETTTTVVNSTGGLMLMNAAPAQGERISIINKKTSEELPCKVAFVGLAEGNRSALRRCVVAVARPRNNFMHGAHADDFSCGRRPLLHNAPAKELDPPRRTLSSHPRDENRSRRAREQRK